jgi:hypothetical protein
MKRPEVNLWGNVTIVTASDFGRTLTSNGVGTDHGGHALHPHSAPPVVLCLWLDMWLIDRDAVLVCAAWGGNMVIMGGAVNGSQVHGQYHLRVISNLWRSELWID